MKGKILNDRFIVIVDFIPRLVKIAPLFGELRRFVDILVQRTVKYVAKRSRWKTVSR